MPLPANLYPYLIYSVCVERSSGAAVNEKAKEEKHHMYCDALSALPDGCKGGEWMKGRREWGVTGREENKGKCKLPIGDTSNGALLKLHHVAGEGPGLVRENVFHLHEENKKIHLIASWLLNLLEES